MFPWLDSNFFNLHDWFLAGRKSWYCSKERCTWTNVIIHESEAGTLKSEIALTLKLLLLWLSNCRKLLILGCSFTWCKPFILFMSMYDQTPLWIGSIPRHQWSKIWSLITIGCGNVSDWSHQQRRPRKPAVLHLINTWCRLRTTWLLQVQRSHHLLSLQLCPLFDPGLRTCQVNEELHCHKL